MTNDNLKKDIEKKIDQYYLLVKEVPEKVDHNFEGLMKNLEEKKNDLVNKVEQFNSKGQSAAEDISIGLDMAMKDFDIAYKSAKERFTKH